MSALHGTGEFVDEVPAKLRELRVDLVATHQGDPLNDQPLPVEVELDLSITSLVEHPDKGTGAVEGSKLVEERVPRLRRDCDRATMRFDDRHRLEFTSRDQAQA